MTITYLLLASSLLHAKVVSHEARLEAIRRAQIAQPVDVAAMDLLAGPQGEGSYPPGAEIRCRYEERDPKRPIGGHSKKFPCVDSSGTRLKVKYGAENTEVRGEVAGTRLFWALGFFAERMYPVKIVCENCPEDPFVSDKTPRATRVFEPATVQKRLKGEEISEVEDEGWRFSELDLAPDQAQADALKLLAALVNHGDNTANQQRLLRLPNGDVIMYVTDLGGTFGGRSHYTNLKHWSRKASLWKDKAACRLDFSGTDSSYRDPVISEAGRAFLAERLSKLSNKQLKDLFTAARLTPVDEWVKEFDRKRAEIVTTRCPK